MFIELDCSDEERLLEIQTKTRWFSVYHISKIRQVNDFYGQPTHTKFMCDGDIYYIKMPAKELIQKITREMHNIKFNNKIDKILDE